MAPHVTACRHRAAAAVLLPPYRVAPHSACIYLHFTMHLDITINSVYLCMSFNYVATCTYPWNVASRCTRGSSSDGSKGLSTLNLWCQAGCLWSYDTAGSRAVGTEVQTLHRRLPPSWCMLGQLGWHKGTMIHPSSSTHAWQGGEGGDSEQGVAVLRSFSSMSYDCLFQPIRRLPTS